MSEMSKKLEKVNKSQLSGNKKSTKVNSRENILNIKINLPLVVKLQKTLRSRNIIAPKCLKLSVFAKTICAGRWKTRVKLRSGEESVEGGKI